MSLDDLLDKIWLLLVLYWIVAPIVRRLRAKPEASADEDASADEEPSPAERTRLARYLRELGLDPAGLDLDDDPSEPQPVAAPEPFEDSATDEVPSEDVEDRPWSAWLEGEAASDDAPVDWAAVQRQLEASRREAAAALDRAERDLAAASARQAPTDAAHAVWADAVLLGALLRPRRSLRG